MKKLLILIQQDPYENSRVSEGIDLAFAAATFDIDVAIVFAKEGLVCLTSGQSTSEIQRRSVEKKIKSLPIYGIEQLYALEDLTLDIQSQISVEIKTINEDRLMDLFTEFEEIQVF